MIYENRNLEGYVWLFKDLLTVKIPDGEHPPLDRTNTRAFLKLRDEENWTGVADSLDDAFEDLSAIYNPTTERRLQALDLRYALHEPGEEMRSYRRVGERLPRLTSIPAPIDRPGISQGVARRVVLSGLRALRFYSLQNPISEFVYQPPVLMV